MLGVKMKEDTFYDDVNPYNFLQETLDGFVIKFCTHYVDLRRKVMGCGLYFIRLCISPYDQCNMWDIKHKKAKI